MGKNSKCENCRFDVTQSDDFCSNCGAIFIEENCENHAENSAVGVCLICKAKCCSKCGLEVCNVFLCNEHSDVEVIQSMGRVYGSSDSLEIDLIISMLEEENFNPFRYCRKASPISLGGTDYSLFRASGDSSGNIINEIKIMVPLGEYLKAVEFVDQLEKK